MSTSAAVEIGAFATTWAVTGLTMSEVASVCASTNSPLMKLRRTRGAADVAVTGAPMRIGY